MEHILAVKFPLLCASHSRLRVINVLTAFHRYLGSGKTDIRPLEHKSRKMELLSGNLRKVPSEMGSGVQQNLEGV